MFRFIGLRIGVIKHAPYFVSMFCQQNTPVEENYSEGVSGKEKKIFIEILKTQETSKASEIIAVGRKRI